MSGSTDAPAAGLGDGVTSNSTDTTSDDANVCVRATVETTHIISCFAGSPYNGSLGLRVGAIFIILATSMLGALFPILTRRIRAFRVPTAIFDFARYFGGGVIVATAFIHLLAPAFDELGSDCLGEGWGDYDYAAGIALTSVFAIFVVELFAFRFGMSYLEGLGINLDAGHVHGAPGEMHEHHTAHEHRPDTRATELAHQHGPLSEKGEASSLASSETSANAAAQILGVVILEFGVIFHSIIIGLTLAVTDEFVTLFIVIIFHQMFEGLGLGARLAFLPLPARLNWVPLVMGATYAAVTPIGIAIGLGVRYTYNPESATALIVSGVLDAISAGILLYTGLVELLAHEFLFSGNFRKAPMSKLLYALGCTITGAGIMALLGRWA